MKIFIGYQDIDSGAKVVTEHVVKAFQKINPHLELIIYKQPPYTFSGVFAFTKNFYWSIWNFKKTLDAIPVKIDAIYSPYYLLYIAQLFSKHRKVPFYFHLHGDQAAQGKISGPARSLFHNLYTLLINNIIAFLQKHVIQNAHRVFFVSQKAQRGFLRHYRIAFRKKNFVIVPNGVSLAEFFPLGKIAQRQKRQLFGQAKNALILLYVGRIDHKKGVLELIRSLDFLKTHKKNHLYIVHPDIPDRYSRAYLQLLKKTASTSWSKISFVQNVRHLVDFYQIADLVLLPSHQEMMPLALLEAFACGTPFVGSTAGNMPDFLQKIDKNLILKKITPREIAAKITWFLKLSEKQKNKISQLEKTRAKDFSWENCARKITEQLVQY